MRWSGSIGGVDVIDVEDAQPQLKANAMDALSSRRVGEGSCVSLKRTSEMNVVIKTAFKNDASDAS